MYKIIIKLKNPQKEQLAKFKEQTPKEREYFRNQNQNNKDRVNVRKIPASGEEFVFANRFFVALGYEQGGLLAISKEPLKNSMEFDVKGNTNWGNSSLRIYLNENYYYDITKHNRKMLLPFTSDLTWDNGRKDYGPCIDNIFLLSNDLYRKYYNYIPTYSSWWWTITPHDKICETYVNTLSYLSYNPPNNLASIVPCILINLHYFDK